MTMNILEAKVQWIDKSLLKNSQLSCYCNEHPGCPRLVNAKHRQIRLQKGMSGPGLSTLLFKELMD